MQSAAAQTGPLAITHVTVIDATGAASQPDVTVLVSDMRVSAIGREVQIPEKGTVVQGAGKFLIPGLWDMHVHWTTSATSRSSRERRHRRSRDVGLPRHLEQRKRIADGRSLVGPRLAIAGTIIDGPKPFWPESIAADAGGGTRGGSPHARRTATTSSRSTRGLPRDVYFAIARRGEEARHSLRRPRAGPGRVAEPRDAGMKSIEHLTGMALAVSGTEVELRQELRRRGEASRGRARRAPARDRCAHPRRATTPPTAAALYAKLKRTARGRCRPSPCCATAPTRIAGIRERSRACATCRRGCTSCGTDDFRRRERTAAQAASQMRLFQRRLELVGEMHRAGVGILAGSDVLNPYCFPGFSLHDELGWLVKAGLHADGGAAGGDAQPGALPRAARAGTVEPGKLADLVAARRRPAPGHRQHPAHRRGRGQRQALLARSDRPDARRDRAHGAFN